jgi:HPt (histidine-containing phosphotransfer) domain-containing protein
MRLAYQVKVNLKDRRPSLEDNNNRLPTIDPALLKQQMPDGDLDLLKELADLLQDETPKQMEAIKKAIQGNDPVGVQHGAHRIKGSALTLGAAAMADICLKLEQAGKQGNLQDSPQLLSSLEEAYQRTLEELGKLLSG